MKKCKYWWSRERHNPQLGIYYVKHGQISAREAKKYEKSLCGDNCMLKFSSFEEYQAKIIAVKEDGYTVMEG